MADGDPIVINGNATADTADFIVDGSTSGTGAIDLTEIGGDASANVYRESDPDGDGTFEISVRIDTPSSQFHSQKNLFIVSSTENVRLRINNNSGGSANYYAAGYEVTDA
jgi:hypothetical protein